MLRKPYSITALVGAISLFLVISLLIYPEHAFHSALRGLKIWWDVVFPALLPFFITSEILMGFGVVHFLGVLLEPFMRPVFNVPGTGAFVMAMGLASGYPIGAKLTARLREQELISRVEGERLVSFTNTADPLFMFGAVAVGFFHDVSLGVTIAIAHYLSSLALGVLMRFHEPKGQKTTIEKNMDAPLLYRAFLAMHEARMKDGRSFGKLMGDAITSSTNTLMLVGGFIIMFSVVIAILSKVGITAILSAAITLLFYPLGIPSELSTSVIAGIFEITLGSQVASQAPPEIPMVHKIAVAGAIIAWSGLSVHAQVASLLSKTDIRYKPYFYARIIHAILAGAITYLIWEPVQRHLVSSNISVFFQNTPAFGATEIWERFTYLGFKATIILLVLIIISLVIYAVKRFGKR